MGLRCKKAAIIFAIILAILSIYFGSYLPLLKARRFIYAINRFSLASSIEEAQQSLDHALNFYSPVGQSEHVRFMGNQMIELLLKKPDAATSEFLIHYTEEKFKQLSKLSRGLNYVQNFLILGNMYEILGMNYGKIENLDVAITYYKEGLPFSPNRPQLLFGLLSVYRKSGRSEETKEVAERIVALWPDKLITESLKQIDSTSSKP